MLFLYYILKIQLVFPSFFLLFHLLLYGNLLNFLSKIEKQQITSPHGSVIFYSKNPVGFPIFLSPIPSLSGHSPYAAYTAAPAMSKLPAGTAAHAAHCSLLTRIERLDLRLLRRKPFLFHLHDHLLDLLIIMGNDLFKLRQILSKMIQNLLPFD